MSKIFKVDENGVTFIHEMPDDTPRVFADGFGPALYGFPLTTVSLFQQQLGEPDDVNTIRRKVTMTLEIPTLAILELAQNIQKTLRENKDTVMASMATMEGILNRDV